MTTGPIHAVDPASDNQRLDRKSLSVWMLDMFAFTPWYTCALSQALVKQDVYLRLICPPPAREAGYFAEHGLSSEPGLSPLGTLAEHAPRRIKQGLRLVQTVANQVLQCHSILLRPDKLPDVIHLQQLPLLNHGIKTDFWLIAAARRAGVPVLHTVHNVLPHDSGESSRAIYTALYRQVDALICHSEEAANTLTQDFLIPGDKITVIPHGPLFAPKTKLGEEDRIEARRRLGISTIRPLFLCQGILAPYKGIDVLLQAWNLAMTALRVSEEDRPLLLIAGAGPAMIEADVRRTGAESGGTIAAELRYLHSSELQDYYAAADVLVYPYRHITTSGALLTGLSFAKPILASDLPPFHQYLKHEENALLVEPGSVAGLASSLMRLSLAVSTHRRSLPTGSDRGLYATLLAGAEGNHCRMTSWQAIGRQTRKLYDALHTHSAHRD